MPVYFIASPVFLRRVTLLSRMPSSYEALQIWRALQVQMLTYPKDVYTCSVLNVNQKKPTPRKTTDFSFQNRPRPLSKVEKCFQVKWMHANSYRSGERCSRVFTIQLYRISMDILINSSGLLKENMEYLVHISIFQTTEIDRGCFSKTPLPDIPSKCSIFCCKVNAIQLKLYLQYIAIDIYWYM